MSELKTLGEMEANDPTVFATKITDAEWAKQEAANKKKREYESAHTPTYTAEEIAEHEAEHEAEQDEE